MLNNQLDRFSDNYDGQQTDERKRTLGILGQEIENKLRFDWNEHIGDWKFSAGADLQYVKYNNDSYTQLSPQIVDSLGNVLQPALEFRFKTAINFVKYGLFGQVSRSFFDSRLAVSAGARADANSFTTDGNNIAKTLSPRLNASFALAKQWKLNANIGSYTKIAAYTVLGYRDNNNNLANTDVPYTRCNHCVTGLEYLPSKTLRLTVEGFYKQCSDFLVRDLSGISLPIWVVMAASLAMKKWSAAAKAKLMSLLARGCLNSTRGWEDIFSRADYRKADVLYPILSCFKTIQVLRSKH